MRLIVPMLQNTVRVPTECSLACMLQFLWLLQDDVVTVHEPIDLLLSCVRQVLLLAKPRDRQIPDSVLEMPIGDTTPSLLRAAGASQQHGPDQVKLRDLNDRTSTLTRIMIASS